MGVRQNSLWCGVIGYLLLLPEECVVRGRGNCVEAWWNTKTKMHGME